MPPVTEIAPDVYRICTYFPRPARGMADGERFSTGRYRFRFIQTPHVPHCWEAGLLFEETNGTLLCSDLFHQNGEVDRSDARLGVCRRR